MQFPLDQFENQKDKNLSKEDLQQFDNKLDNDPKKDKIVTLDVEELLEVIPHDELKHFIIEQASETRTFRDLFLASFVQYNPRESKELYVNQIQAILNMVVDKDGFIDEKDVKRVSDSVNKLLNKAKNQIKNKNYYSAFLICIAVMEEMNKAMEYVEDFYSNMYVTIDYAYDYLWKIAQKPLPEEMRKLLFEYGCTAYEDHFYSGSTWHVGMLELAASLIKTDEEVEYILDQIDTEYDIKYGNVDAQGLKYDILLKFKGENVANQYLEQNITNPDLRRIALGKAMYKKDYVKAKSLAQYGVNHDLKYGGIIVQEWYDWLLEIAQIQNDTEKIIEYARLLLTQGYRSDQDYYQILKQHVKPEEWNELIEAVVENCDNWFFPEHIAPVYIQEEWWDRLLELMKEFPNLQLIEKFEKYLAKDYSREIVELYADEIIQYMKDYQGRYHYQEACRYITKMIMLGGEDKAKEVILHLKNEYPKRKALIQELNKIQ